jgi:hypothetical protein
MSSSLSRTIHKQLLDSVFGSGTPATIFMAAMSTAPDLAGAGGVEFTGGAYARASLTNNATNFPAATDVGDTATKTLANAASFPAATIDHPDCVAIAFYDAASGGTFLGLYTLPTAQAIPTGVVLTVQAGSTITLAPAA